MTEEGRLVRSRMQTTLSAVVSAAACRGLYLEHRSPDLCLEIESQITRIQTTMSKYEYWTGQITTSTHSSHSQGGTVGARMIDRSLSEVPSRVQLRYMKVNFLCYTDIFFIDWYPVEELLHPARPASRASTARDSTSQCTITEDPRSPRSLSRHSSDRRPMGPRSPSPLPPPRSPRPTSPPLPEIPSIDDELAAEISDIVQPTPTKSGIPRSKRQIFHPVNNIDSTPKPHTNGMARASSSVEPLSIKKKTSVRNAIDLTDTPVTGRKSGRNSLSRTPARSVTSSPRRVSPQIRLGKVAGPSISSPHMVHDLDKIVSLARTTKEDVSVTCFRPCFKSLP